MSVPGDIQKLYYKSPLPPGDVPPAGVSSEVLEEFKSNFGVTIPPELEDWLRFANGPCIGPGGIFGIKPTRDILDMQGVYERYPAWRDRGWIPIASDGCGNFYVIVRVDDKWPVVFVDTIADESKPCYVVASNLWQFLRFLLMKEMGNTKWPFSAEEVLRADPEIANSNVAPLPWHEESSGFR